MLSPFTLELLWRINLKRFRASYSANGPHEPLLQVGLSKRHASLVGIFQRFQLIDEVPAPHSDGLPFVHQVDFFLSQVAITDDLFVLVFHVTLSGWDD